MAKKNSEYARLALQQALDSSGDDMDIFVRLYFPCFRGLTRDRSADISEGIFQWIFEETGTTHGTELIQWLDAPERGAKDFRNVLSRVLKRLDEDGA